MRIDSPERARNLDLTLRYLCRTGIRIEIWEIDVEQKYRLKFSLECVFYHFVFDPVFHRTFYWDVLFKKSTYPVVGIWDADIIIEYWQIEEALRRIVEGDSVVCIPYNGVVKALSSKASREYAECGKTTFGGQFSKETIRLMGRPSTGGAVLMNRIHVIYCVVLFAISVGAYLGIFSKCGFFMHILMISVHFLLTTCLTDGKINTFFSDFLLLAAHPQFSGEESLFGYMDFFSRFILRSYAPYTTHEQGVLEQSA